MDKKILYFLSFRNVLKGRVSSIMMMQTCYSISKLGNTVSLICPRVFDSGNVSSNRLWGHYALEQNSFNVIFLPTLLNLKSRDWNIKFQKFLYHLVYATKVFFEALIKPKGSVIIISRDFISTYPYINVLRLIKKWRRVLILFELHYIQNNFNYRYIINHTDGLIVISEALKNELIREGKFDSNRVLVARMGVNLENYPNEYSKNNIREDLGLNINSFIVAYTGKVAKNMIEIKYIIDTAQKLPQMEFLIVGGKKEAVAFWNSECKNRKIRNIEFTGFVEPSSVFKYQMAADALLMYYPSDWLIKDYFSPSKMMEYMAAGKPIVSVDFPAIREVLKHEKNALLVESDRPDLLVKSIHRLYSDRQLSEKLGKEAKKDVKEFSWNNRAVSIMNFIQSLYT